MKRYVLQGRKDAIKLDLIANYEFAKSWGKDVMKHKNKITGESFLETSTLIEDGRVLVEIKKI